MTKTIWQAFYHYLYLSFRRTDANIDINLLTDADANTDTNIRVKYVKYVILGHSIASS